MGRTTRRTCQQSRQLARHGVQDREPEPGSAGGAGSPPSWAALQNYPTKTSTRHLCAGTICVPGLSEVALTLGRPVHGGGRFCAPLLQHRRVCCHGRGSSWALPPAFWPVLGQACRTMVGPGFPRTNVRQLRGERTGRWNPARSSRSLGPCLSPGCSQDPGPSSRTPLCGAQHVRPPLCPAVPEHKMPGTSRGRSCPLLLSPSKQHKALGTDFPNLETLRT